MYSKDQVDVEYATEYTTLKFIEIKLGLFKDLESLEGCELDEDKTPRNVSHPAKTRPRWNLNLSFVFYLFLSFLY